MSDRSSLPAIGHYSPVVLPGASAQMAFVSGQLPIDPVTGQMANSVAGQVRQALTNGLTVLASVGGAASDIVKVTVFTTDLHDYEALNQAYADALGPFRPARSIVEVARLPRDAMVEIEIIAAIPPRPAPAHGREPRTR